MPARFGEPVAVASTPSTLSETVASAKSEPSATPAIEGVLPDEEVAALLDPEVRLGDLQGISAEQAGAIFEAITEPLNACRLNKRVQLRIRIVADADGASLQLDPRAPIPPSTRRCVLEAISTTEFEEAIGANANSPSDAPRRIESLITINW